MVKGSPEFQQITIVGLCKLYRLVEQYTAINQLFYNGNEGLELQWQKMTEIPTLDCFFVEAPHVHTLWCLNHD